MTFENITDLEMSYSLESLNSTLDSYERILTECDSLIGLEKYNVLLIPFTGTFNLIHRMLSNFSLVFTRLLKQIKNSELRDYHNRYPLNVRRAFNVKFLDVANVEVAVPTGMKVSYLEAIKTIENFFSFSNLQIFEKFLKDLEALYRYTGAHNSIEIDHVLSAISAGKNEVDLSREKIYQKHIENFSDKKVPPFVAFNTKFNSINEFKEVDTKLIALSKVIMDLDKIAKISNQTITIVERLLGYIKASDSQSPLVTPEFIKKLSEYIRNLAEAYDMYASVVETDIVLEHVFCKVIEKIYNES